MSTIHYFEMTIADYEETFKLWKNSPGIALSKADSKQKIAQFITRNPGLSFVSRDREQLVGAVLCGNDGRRGYLYHLAVAKDYQHLGIGKMLTEKVLGALKEQGIEKCHIFVIAENLDGMRFWQKRGWKKRDDIFAMSFDL
jgi:ribosomal protein S18 acetylase RimI-like enzyme